MKKFKESSWERPADTHSAFRVFPPLLCEWEAMSRREGTWLGVSNGIAWSQLQHCWAVWLGRAIYSGGISVFSLCNGMTKMLPPAALLTSWIFFHLKNPLTSRRCKGSVNCSASQVYGGNISTVYSWMYQSGISIAWNLAIFFSSVKILWLNFVLGKST